MNYEDAMTAMKAGRVARREGWEGHVRIDGLQIIRVKPNVLPHRFYPSADDKRATDWAASQSPGVSILPPKDVSSFFNQGSTRADEAVDGSADRR